MPQTPGRVPNLLHTLFFVVLTYLCIVLAGAALAAGSRAREMSDRMVLPAEAAAYVVALAVAWFFFGVLWERPFLDGIEWNGRAARPWLAVFGLVLGFLAQAAEALFPDPGKVPVEELFHSGISIWLLALFGSVMAPVFEEIVFRGFLLPALALAVDWLWLPRGADAAATLAAWRSAETFSRPALVVSALITSVLFSLIHAPQVGYALPSIALLAVVSLVLCAVRIRMRSVAASALVHGCYNLSVFVAVFVGTGGFRHMERM